MPDEYLRTQLLNELTRLDTEIMNLTSHFALAHSNFDRQLIQKSLDERRGERSEAQAKLADLKMREGK